MNNEFLIFKHIEGFKRDLPSLKLPKLEFKFNKDEIELSKAKLFKYTLQRYGCKVEFEETDNEYLITMNTKLV